MYPDSLIDIMEYTNWCHPLTIAVAVIPVLCEDVTSGFGRGMYDG